MLDLTTTLPPPLKRVRSEEGSNDSTSSSSHPSPFYPQRIPIPPMLASPSFASTSRPSAPTGFSLPSIYELAGHSPISQSPSLPTRRPPSVGTSSHPFSLYEQQALASQTVDQHYHPSSNMYYRRRGEASSDSSSSLEHSTVEHQMEGFDAGSEAGDGHKKQRNRIQLSCTECKKRKVRIIWTSTLSRGVKSISSLWPYGCKPPTMLSFF